MFLFLLVTEEYQAPLEGVNRNGNFWMVFDDFPCFFHPFGPVNVVKNPNGFVGNRW